MECIFTTIVRHGRLFYLVWGYPGENPLFRLSGIIMNKHDLHDACSDPWHQHYDVTDQRINENTNKSEPNGRLQNRPFDSLKLSLYEQAKQRVTHNVLGWTHLAKVGDIKFVTFTWTWWRHEVISWRHKPGQSGDIPVRLYHNMCITAIYMYKQRYIHLRVLLCDVIHFDDVITNKIIDSCTVFTVTQV